MTGVGEGATPLMYACQQSQEKQVLDILNKKPLSARETDRTKKTPLHYCAENFNTNCAESLLRVAPDTLNARDEDGYSPLHLAVIAGNKPLIQVLLSRGADVNSLDHEGHSVVHWATVCGEQEALEMVLRAGANISTADMHGGYPLHYAAQMCGPGADMQGDSRAALNILRTLLAFGADVDERDKDGRQPILWAASADSQSRDPGARFASSGSAEAILTLVKAGAKVEAADKDGLTALHCAASRGHTDCLETLVALCGAYVDTIDVNGCTALFYSTTLGHADATQLLLNLGAEPNRQDRKGRTPAHCGAAKGQLETLRLLLAGGANLWLRNVKGDLTLHEGVASGRRELVTWLLNQRPEAVNVANNDGKCAIHVAAVNNNIDMVKILLDSGSMVNPVLRSNKGVMMTPLDAALHRGHRSCAKFLQLHGGVPRAKLSDAAAALRGSAPSREMTLDELATERDILHRIPLAAHVTYTASPRFVENRMHIRVGEDDAAIQHVERIEVPVCHHGHHYEIESSDHDCRHRRRRRRRRSERRRRDSVAQEDSNEDDVSQDSVSRPFRKSSRRRTSDEVIKKPRKQSKEYDRDSSRYKVESEGSEETTEEESESFDARKDSAELSEEEKSKGKIKNQHAQPKKKDDLSKKNKIPKQITEPQVPQVKSADKSNLSEPKPKDVESSGGKNGAAKIKKSKAGKNVRDESITSENMQLSSKNGTSEDAPAKVKKKISEDDDLVPVTRRSSKDEDLGISPRASRTSSSKNGEKARDASARAIKSSTGKRNEDNVDSCPKSGSSGNEKNVDMSLDSPPKTARQGNLNSKRNDTAVERSSSTEKADSPAEQHDESVEEPPVNNNNGTNDDNESEENLIGKETAGKSTAQLGSDIMIVPLTERPPPAPSDSSLEEGNKAATPKFVEVEADVHQSALETDEEKTDIKEIKPTKADDEKETTKFESPESVIEDFVTEQIHVDNKDAPVADKDEIPADDFEEEETDKATSEDSGTTPPTRVATARRRSLGSERGLIGIMAEDDLDLSSSRRSEMSGVGEDEMPIRIPSRRQSVVFGEAVGREEMDEMVAEMRRKGRTKSEGENIPSVRGRRGSLFKRSESEEREETVLRLADVDTVIKGVALDEPEGRSASVGDDSGGSTRHEDSSVLPDSGIEPSPRHGRRTPTTSPRRRVPRLCRKGRSNEQPVAPVSVTRAVQNTIRKYHLERKIFYQLLELKRLQIRAGRANEQILVKRLVDEYQRACQIAGLEQYSGLYSFRQFERFLYDQLHTLQAGAQIVIPQLKPSDDIETLSTILKRTRVELLDDALDNPTLCTRGTHRCHHAAHAYTGIPCAAYITKLNHHTMPKDKRSGFLPFIEPSTESRPCSRRGSDRPVTLELVHGRDKQVISLPTDRLDRSKRYYVTFTIKGGEPTPPKSESPAGERNPQQQQQQQSF